MALHMKAADADLLYVWISGEILHGALLTGAGSTGRGIPVELPRYESFKEAFHWPPLAHNGKFA
jgi:hypothetical protein